MRNARFDLMPDYAFPRLRALIDGIAPGGPGAPILMQLGEPQHPFPDFVPRIIAEESALYTKYPPVDGTPALRKAIAGWLSRRFGLPEGAVDEDRMVLPLSGTKEGLFTLALAVVPEAGTGRRPAVLMPNPFYQCYVAAALAAGAEPVYVAAEAENGFLPDYGSLDEALLARTALVYICSPSNPEGAVADLDYLAALVRLARRFGFVLAADECYSEIYDRASPPSVLRAALETSDDLPPGAHPFRNIVAFNSLSKRSSVPGLRSGFIAGDPDILGEYRMLRAYGGPVLPLPICAASAACWSDEDHVEANRALYREKFEIARSILGNRPGFTRPAGGFFLWLDVGDSQEAARRLWAEAGVQVLPGAYLAHEDAAGYNPGARYVRIALVHDRKVTEEGLRRIADSL